MARTKSRVKTKGRHARKSDNVERKQRRTKRNTKRRTHRKRRRPHKGGDWRDDWIDPAVDTFLRSVPSYNQTVGGVNDAGGFSPDTVSRRRDRINSGRRGRANEPRGPAEETKWRKFMKWLNRQRDDYGRGVRGQPGYQAVAGRAAERREHGEVQPVNGPVTLDLRRHPNLRDYDNSWPKPPPAPANPRDKKKSKKKGWDKMRELTPERVRDLKSMDATWDYGDDGGEDGEDGGEDGDEDGDEDPPKRGTGSQPRQTRQTKRKSKSPRSTETAGGEKNGPKGGKKKGRKTRTTSRGADLETEPLSKTVDDEGKGTKRKKYEVTADTLYIQKSCTKIATADFFLGKGSIFTAVPFENTEGDSREWANNIIVEEAKGDTSGAPERDQVIDEVYCVKLKQNKWGSGRGRQVKEIK